MWLNTGLGWVGFEVCSAQSFCPCWSCALLLAPCSVRVVKTGRQTARHGTSYSEVIKVGTIGQSVLDRCMGTLHYQTQRCVRGMFAPRSMCSECAISGLLLVALCKQRSALGLTSICSLVWVCQLGSGSVITDMQANLFGLWHVAIKPKIWALGRALCRCGDHAHRGLDIVGLGCCSSAETLRTRALPHAWHLFGLGTFCFTRKQRANLPPFRACAVHRCQGWCERPVHSGPDNTHRCQRPAEHLLHSAVELGEQSRTGQLTHSRSLTTAAEQAACSCLHAIRTGGDCSLCWTHTTSSQVCQPQGPQTMLHLRTRQPCCGFSPFVVLCTSPHMRGWA